jgi:hypothetical protein
MIKDKWKLYALRVRVRVMVFNATFNNICYIVVVSFIGGGNQNTQRKLEYPEKTTDLSQVTGKSSIDIIS